ncbi:MAG: type IV pilus modification protein PilV [Gammaproteobacteria bacterium]|nr:type IV pilus modification protein PilV [Gammaproteobacteria bacterium]
MSVRDDTIHRGTERLLGPTLPLRGARPSAGFTLLEVLIALLVLSLGLLGLAALQAATVEFNHEAYLRSQATNLAYDMADRMRANRQAALNGDYSVAFANPAPACGNAGGASVAARDIAAWHGALACTLPAGNGRIQVANGTVTIEVRWDESRGAEAPEMFEMATAL